MSCCKNADKAVADATPILNNIESQTASELARASSSSFVKKKNQYTEEFLSDQRTMSQNMLPQTLVKNVHFHNDLDTKPLVDESYQFMKELCEESLAELHQSWGLSYVHSFKVFETDSLTVVKVDNMVEGVIVTEGWNKVLAFKNMFAEALIAKWRLSCAVDNIRNTKKTRRLSLRRRLHAGKSILVPSTVRKMYSSSSSSSELDDLKTQTKAFHEVERSQDPVALSFGERTKDLKILVVTMLDMAVRDICPHAQVVQREAYRSSLGSMDPDHRVAQVFLHDSNCTTFEKVCKMMASYGLHPWFWVLLCDSFLWAMKSHNPYLQPHEIDELEKPKAESAFGKFVSGMVGLPLLEATLRYSAALCSTYMKDLTFIINQDKMETLLNIGPTLFANVFEKYPELSDYFAKSDIDEVSIQLMDIICAIIRDADLLSNPSSLVRDKLIVHGEVWRQLEAPVDTFTYVGMELIELITPIFMESFPPHHAEKMRSAFAFVFREAKKIIVQPLFNDDNLLSEAKLFYEDVAKELNWTSQVLEDRLFEVSREINMSGMYTHTTTEIEVGARLCWRNSAKCIGRIAWNTLEVRDRRHCTNPNEMAIEIVEHLKLATAGTNIQSVMTVFRPQQKNELWGLRFWSSQFLRYAGYKDNKTGAILGDPANEKFTSYLIDMKLWSPPQTKSPFDILPLVIKLPYNDVPFVFELPKNVCSEVHIEHPKYPKVKDLNYKWAAVPAISNFVMRIGGIEYPCCPFNGWFVSTEIRRNLMERYDATIPLAKAMDADLDDRMLADIVGSNLENAILYSFEKNGITIVDPMTVGNSFLTHCNRERKEGRECPAQWSWIGGLTGPNNPTWHLEMRDFFKDSQYDYCCNPWDVLGKENRVPLIPQDPVQLQEGTSMVSIPKVVIAFGSETGTAEAAASSLARKLKLCKPYVMTLNQLADSEVFTISPQGTTYLFIVCSTFGQGILPKNAKRFLDVSLSKDICCRLKYAVLALGSSLYPDFCKAGKDIDEKIRKSGAEALMNVTTADAAQDGSVAISQWISKVERIVLPQSLVEHITSLSCLEYTESDDEICYNIEWDSAKPTAAATAVKQSETLMTCKSNIELLNGCDIESRSTKCVELNLPESVTYESGDHLMVHPWNDERMVLRFCECFNQELMNAAVGCGFGRLKDNEHQASTNSAVLFQMKVPFCIKVYQSTLSRQTSTDGDILRTNWTNMNLFDVLGRILDLSFDHTSYVIDLLTMLSFKLKKAKETELGMNFLKMADDTIDAYKKGNSTLVESFVSRFPNIVVFMEEYRSLFLNTETSQDGESIISLADILVIMPSLSPRYYSISSSPAMKPKSITLTVGVVNKTTPRGITVKGVCSNYLARLRPGEKIDARIVSSIFRLPVRRHHPLVFIGSGTGIAPIMSFLEERAKQFKTLGSKAFGECHLFFGCRNENEFLYRDQLVQWEIQGIVKLHVAFSRSESHPRMHVQEALAIYGPKLVDLLLSKDEAYVYICGAAHIANECSGKCIELIGEYGGISRTSAMHYMMKLRVERRWNLDVWGNVRSFNSFEEERKSQLASARSTIRASILQKSFRWRDA